MQAKNQGNEISGVLEKLAEKTAALDQKIKGGCDDAFIKAEMISIHDLFHSIVERCRHEEK